MPDAGLTFGQWWLWFRAGGSRFLSAAKILQETWFVVATAALVIVPERVGGLPGVQPEFAGEKFKSIHQSHQRNAVRAPVGRKAIR